MKNIELMIGARTVGYVTEKGYKYEMHNLEESIGPLDIFVKEGITIELEEKNFDNLFEAVKNGNFLNPKNIWIKAIANMKGEIII